MAAPRVIVVGGGAMGLASAWALARRGAKVTVLERFEHVHARGSHGGHTRIIRESYHEGASYVPLVREATRMWQSLSERIGEPLLVRTGMVELGPPDAPDYAATIAANVASGVVHQEFSAAEARERWPFVVPDGWRALYSPEAGYLRVGPCLTAFRREAESAGAVVRNQVGVCELHRDADGVHAQLASGERVTGDLAVVAAGAYLPGLLPEFLPQRLKVVRRVLAWTRPEAAQREALAGLPVWCVFAPGGFMYGFPWVDEGVDGFKLACHWPPGGEAADAAEDAETVDREVHESDLAPLDQFLGSYLPAARGPFVAASVCLYTCTPSWDFAVDWLPGDPRVVVAGGFSGHGFKFAPAIGDAVADGLLRGELPATLREFSRARHLGADEAEGDRVV